MGKSEWDDDLLNDDENDSSLVKDLRKQLRAAKRDITELTEKVQATEKVARERSVKDVLTSKGVRPGIARFIPEDITSEDDIVKWLEDNAEDLGITLEAGGQDGTPDPSLAEKQRADALQSRGVAPGKLADLQQRIDNAQSDAELAELIAEARQLSL